ncbi:MAG TPA: Zeta toxin family protein, partial [Armatimonadota bacterium]|nr:Zeta toxin family protein [Armatimonadota bacterium]
VWLPTADLSVQRVADRVERGGHSIPEDTVRRRYVSGIRHFYQIFMPMADTWEAYANIEPEGPELVARGVHEGPVIWYNKTIWDRIVEMAGAE